MSNIPGPKSGLEPEPMIQMPAARPTWHGHLAIARFDHWVKNVFVLPGVVIGLGVSAPANWFSFAMRLVVGMLAVGMVASSNYVINEVMDAEFDRFHPTKFRRPVPSGQVSIPLAYVQWIAFMIVGILLGMQVSLPFATVLAVLWVMGLVYNIPPVRTKDLPYVDVISESVNNPLRMLAGWYIAGGQASPPGSLLVSYWMVGAYFMAIKRYAEYREIHNAQVSALYRRSFAFYSEQRLLVSIMFYSSLAMLSFGVFVIRYRMEYVLAFPLVALVMAIYLNLAFKPDSAAQRPEALYREPALMAAVVGCAVVLVALQFVEIPSLYRLLAPLQSGVPATRP